MLKRDNVKRGMAAVIACVFTVLGVCGCSVSSTSGNSSTYAVDGGRSQYVVSSTGNAYYIDLDKDNDTVFALYEKDAATGEVTVLDRTDDSYEYNYTDYIFSSYVYIFDDILYYTKMSKEGCNYLCSIDLKSSEREITSRSFDDDVKYAVMMVLGNGANETDMIEVNGALYMLYDNKIYAVGDELIKMSSENDYIISLYTDGDYVYYSNYSGTVTRFDISTGESDVVLEGEDCMPTDRQQLYGYEVYETLLTIKDNVLYYIGAGAGLNTGLIYAYDLSGESDPVQISEDATKKYVLYGDYIYYISSAYFRRIPITGGDAETFDTPSVWDFSIVDGRIYAYPTDGNGGTGTMYETEYVVE